MAEMDYSRYSPFNEREGQYLTARYDPDELDSGEATMYRKDIIQAGVAPSTQQLRLSYFTAKKTEIVNNVVTVSGTVAAAATPSICKIGVYEVQANGDLTLVASTANTLSLWATTFTKYTTALQSSLSKTQGKRYAVGILVVSAVAIPTFYGHSTIPTVISLDEPAICAFLPGQSDLPSSITKASLTATSSFIYTALIP